MKIGIIGAGNLGTAIAKRLVPQGHQVMLGFSRDLQALQTTAKKYGSLSGSPAETAAFGDVVVLTVPWDAVETAVKQMGDLTRKIVWDCTNVLKADLSGLQFGTMDSGGETVQRIAPTASVVKGIPPFAEILHSEDPTLQGVPAGCFLCSNDPEAKGKIRTLIEQLPATAIDAGPLENARYVEPAAFLLVQLAYRQGMGPRIGIALQLG